MSGWVWEKSPTPTMTWRTGCWANSRGEDKKAIDGAVKRAADAVECLLKEGPDRAMNRFNG